MCIRHPLPVNDCLLAAACSSGTWPTCRAQAGLSRRLACTLSAGLGLWPSVVYSRVLESWNQCLSQSVTLGVYTYDRKVDNFIK